MNIGLEKKLQYGFIHILLSEITDLNRGHLLVFLFSLGLIQQYSPRLKNEVSEHSRCMRHVAVYDRGKEEKRIHVDCVTPKDRSEVIQNIYIIGQRGIQKHFFTNIEVIIMQRMSKPNALKLNEYVFKRNQIISYKI